MKGELVIPAGPGVGQVAQRSAGKIVNHVDRVPLCQQAIDEIRADETGATCHQAAHGQAVSTGGPLR